jgi:pimeloyl-ACP methyl ester carboxylesterase
MIAFRATRAIYLEEAQMRELELTAGVIDYEDSGGTGPVLVLLGGLVMDSSVWDPVVQELRDEFRCIVPTLPLGSHRRPMRADANLTLRGYGGMVAEILELLDLRGVTLVQNDHAAALALAGENPERVARLVISSCEAFENYPPGIPGKNMRVLAFVPGGIYAAMQSMKIRRLRRLPISLGWMSKRPLPDELVDGWLKPMQTNGRVRRDLRRYARAARRRDMLAVCERLRAFTRPALVVWTPEDKVQRPEHGRRLAELLPDARLVEIEDSYTLIMRDQPHAFAHAIREFVRETEPTAAGASNGGAPGAATDSPDAASAGSGGSATGM